MRITVQCRNPFWSRAGFYIKVKAATSITVSNILVAIPFEVGQVSTFHLIGLLMIWLKRSVAIPFEVGQVSTISIRFRDDWDQDVVAIPFEVGQVSTNKEVWYGGSSKTDGRNPFWSRAGFYLLKEGGEQWLIFKWLVAIPFEVGQVSTKRKKMRGLEMERVSRNPFWSRAGFYKKNYKEV